MKMEVYPLVNVYITNWKDPPFYSWVNQRPFDWAIFNSKTVSLPEGTPFQETSMCVHLSGSRKVDMAWG